MRKWLPLGLALLLPVVAACSDFSHPIDRPPSQNNNQHRALSPAEMKARIKARTVDVGGGHRVRSPAPDMGMQNTGSYPKPVSAWQANERKLYGSLLARHSYKVLVVPCQVEIYGFDQPTRSLMTIELSRAIERARGKPLPDPYVVERAFGDGIRRPDYRVSLNVGAKRIISCYVGHLRDGNMTITIGDEELNPRPTGSEAAAGRVPLERYHVHSYEYLAFSDQNPPLDVYRAMLPKILKDLGYDAVASPKRVESSFTANKLPATPFGLIGRQPNPARDAYYLQLLGALTPRREERERERLFEKSLLAIERMKRDSPQYRALKARAYMHLGLRPAALKVLGMPSTAEEKALRAALNGNLPELKASIARERQLVPRMLEMLEANEIAVDYGVITRKDATAAAASLKLPGKIWPVVVARAFINWDTWSQQDNLVLKRILDKQLPIQGYTADGILHGAMAIGDPDKVRTSIDLSVFEHVHRLLAADPAKWCCAMPVDRPTVRDYLDFIGAMATDNLMRRAHYLTIIQGSPDSALKFLSGIQSVYDGYPEFALERAYAESKQAQQAEGAAQEGEGRAALLDALNAMYWSNGQTRVAADAYYLSAELHRRDFGNVGSWYSNDRPFRPFFPDSEGRDTTIYLRNALAALRNSVSDFWPVRELESTLEKMRHKPFDMQTIIRQIKGRFEGCPERDLFFAKRSMKKNDVAEAEAHMREGIADAPGYWRAYSMLGQLFLKLAQPEKSAKVFMSYPGFRKNAPGNPVGISNDAYEAGSDFYWSGDFALAKPLYRIAADLDTGSDASISSAIRLAMLDGNYARALAGSYVRAQRYNSPYAYRDYLGLLHAMGHSKEAWSAFDALVPRLRASPLWETALVGQRMQRMSEAEIVAWANRPVFRDLGKTRNFAAVYLVRAGITDRMPSVSLAKSVAALAWPVWRLPQWHGYVLRAGRSGALPRIVGPKAPFGGAVLPTGVFESVAKEPVTSDLVSFVKAYRALRLGDASGAVKIFRGLTQNYDLTNPELRYLLPYYAFAAARSGETSAVESILNRIEPDKRGFDYFLAKAAISGLAGKTKDALGLLKRALYQRPSTVERPVYTDYQYAGMLEWLYNVTGKPEYHDLALDWVKKVERFTPWYAWPYAIQAELDHDGAGRRRAIAMTAYLDPGSERLAKLPKAKVARAVRAFKGHNPFLQVFAKPKNNGI